MNEKGFSLIESVVVIMLSTVIVMGIQVSIGNIISSTVQNYTAIYQRSENENGSIEPFVKRTASIYGYPSGNNIVSVLGEWTVPLSKYELLKKDESKGKATYHFYKKVLLSD